MRIARAEPRALLELFTSQGCSSCPAADKLLGELADDPSLVALSVPIDYWDYLGWKDTLASPAHSARQRAYARVRGDRQVYTPQIVVNGAMHVLGSDRAAIERMIAQTDQKPRVMSLPVLLTFDGGNLNVTVEAGDGDQSRRRSLAVSARQGGDGRDRPRRKSRPHDHLPQRGAGWVKLGDWTGADVDLECSDVRDQDRRDRCRRRHGAGRHAATSRASSSARPTRRYGSHRE